MFSRDREKETKSNLHLVNNRDSPGPEEPNQDKLFKARPLIESMLTYFSSLEIEEHLSCYEQIIPFKGRSSLKQYNPRKSKKWGYKVFVLSGVSGLVYNFCMYAGNIEPANEFPNIGASGNSVLRLVEVIPYHKNHKL